MKNENEILKESIRILLKQNRQTRDDLLSKTIPTVHMNKAALIVTTRWLEFVNLEIENLEFILENI